MKLLSSLLVLIQLASSEGRLHGDTNLPNDAVDEGEGDVSERHTPTRIFYERKRDLELDVRGEAPSKGTRIIGGGLSDKDEYPYAVSLKGRGGHFCGGSLIARDVVLSAAHCSGATFDVVIGRHRRSSWYEGETISVDAEVSHPSYTSRNTDNDFNLIFLTREARADVELVRLNSDGAVPGSRDSVTSMGWGDTIASESYSQLSNALKEVELEVVSTPDCRAAKGFAGGYYTSYAGAITSNMLCAQAPGGDSCQGDSGGPLVRKSSDGTQDVQVGVVSWGMGCADPVFPGVYARVSSAYSWIRAEVCKRRPNAPASFDCTASDQDIAPDAELPTTCGTEDLQQADYRGAMSSTESGRTCQAWSSQAPHTHSRTEAAYPDGGLGNHNHCRNPDDNDRAWCYTADPGSRWEFCSVPDCASATTAEWETWVTTPEAVPTATAATTGPATTAATAAASTIPDAGTTPATTAPTTVDTAIVGDNPSDDSGDGGGSSGSFASWVCSVFSVFC